LDTHRDEPRPPIGSPEEEVCFRIILDYQEGRLTLENAAAQLLAAMQANPPGLNIEASPSFRRLFAEVQRLAGVEPESIQPNPARHKDGARKMLQALDASIKRSLSDIERHLDEPHKFRCHFAAATEATARALAQWLTNHGHDVTVKSPEEADADDWKVYGDTSTRLWTKQAVEQWADSIGSAPLRGDASFTGWGIF
jgi:hypothetical protein